MRFSVLTEMGQHKDYITREDFIGLFVNHRPVYGIGKNNITEAFQALAMKDNDGRSEENQAIYKQTILRALEREGEGIAPQELQEIFKMLIGT